MCLVIRALIVLAVSLVTALPAFTDGKAKKKPETFTDIVNEHFAEWDRNRDGKLSAEEVNALVAATSIKDNQAAAVAAIHVYFRQHKKSPPLSKDELTKLAHKAAPEERRDVTRKQAHLTSDFQAYVGHIKRSPRELFVDNKAPSLDGFHQGNLGDCYLLAAVGSAINRSPESVQRMIRPLKDGWNEVHFGNGAAVRVTPLSDAEIALGSSAGKQGTWLNVLEKSFGTEEIMKSRKPSNDTALDKIAHGGAPSHTIEVFTGHEAATVTLRHTKGKESHPLAPRDIPAARARLHAELKACMAVKSMTCCATGTYKLPPGVISDHAYAVIGFDAAKDTVTIWNPWGNKFEPKGKEGLEHGYEVKGGKFTVPLNDFMVIFEEFYYETNRPLRARR